MSRRWASSEQILPAQRHLRHNEQGKKKGEGLSASIYKFCKL